MSHVQALRTEAAVRHPWVALAVVCAAYFMIQLDTTIVYVALPRIQSDLGFSASSLSWVSNAYILLYGGFLLLGGRATDLYGRRRVLLIGVAVFTAASLGNALSVSPGMLIGFRVLQGLGGALTAPAALSIVNTLFPEGPARTRAMSIWGAMAGGGAGFGFLAGGVLTQFLSWEWVFLVNLPIGLLVIAATRHYAPKLTTQSTARFDLLGALTATTGLIVLVYAVVGSERAGWLSAQTLGLATIAVILLTAFVVAEQRVKAPLVRLGIFRTPSVAVANTGIILAQAALFGFFFLGSLYLQAVLGYSPLQAGMAFLVFPLGLFAGIAIAGRLINQFGLPKVLAGGLVLDTLGLVLLSGVTTDGTFVSDFLPGLVPLAIGAGATIMPFTMLGTSDVAEREQGLASGLFTTSTQVGGALGIAVLSTLAAHATGTTVAPASEALTAGMRMAYTVATALMVAALLVVLRLRPWARKPR